MDLENWYIAARSDQLSLRKPLARMILGRPIVLYRDSKGSPVALEDRCPHKNVALSLGRVKGDTLECRYHGWQFDRSGACVSVPCHGPGEPLPRCRAGSLPLVEQDDWIWVYPGQNLATAGQPPRYPKNRKLGWFELHNVMRAPVDLILENGVDCSHTGFVHRGLFRSAPRQFVRAQIAETPIGVKIDTLDEKRGDGAPITHTDELIRPHTVKVDYAIEGRRGKSTHVVTVLVCTPEDEHTTRVYTRMGVYQRRLTWLATLYIHLLTRLIVAQDKRILQSQAETIRRFGKRSFHLATADQPAAWMQRGLRRAPSPGETDLKSTEVEYRL